MTTQASTFGRKVLWASAAVLLLAAGCSSQNPSSPSAANNNSSQTGNQTPASQKFSDQSYYKNAYLISGDSLNSDAQKALTGFDMSKQANADGSATITLKALKSGYNDQQYTLKSGEQLYFIEKFLADDDGAANNDKATGDDSAVVVDGSGNIVQGPQGWSQQ